MAISDWQKKKEEVFSYKARANVLARVVGYQGEQVLVDVLPLNQDYDGPSHLAVSLTSADTKLTVASMSDPASIGYKKADSQTGGIIGISSVVLRKDLQPVAFESEEYTSAETSRFFGAAMDTDRPGRLQVFPGATWHKEVQSTRTVKIEGRDEVIAPQIKTVTSLPYKAQLVSGIDELKAVGAKMCKTQGELEGRNSVGFTMRVFNSDTHETITQEYIPGLVLHRGEEWRRAQEGEDAIQALEGKQYYQDFTLPLLSAIEDGSLGNVKIELYPTIRSTAGKDEVEMSGLFDENGQINERGQRVNQKYRAEDGKTIIPEIGMMLFRRTEHNTMRPHIGLPFTFTQDRYAGVLDQIPSANYTGDGFKPVSMLSATAAAERHAALDTDSLADVDLGLDDLDAEMPDFGASSGQSVENNFSPEPEPSPSPKQAETATESPGDTAARDEPVDDFNPSFEASFDEEFDEEPAPNVMGR